ncbi:MAG: HPr family phosphocarrier protein [Lachnospiraceae bacterium]
MKCFPVVLNRTEDMINFVRLVSKYDEDVDLKSGSILIDAKSIIGAINLVGAVPLEMRIHSDDCENLVSSVAAYIKMR